jgi:heptosyltransferase-3
MMLYSNIKRILVVKLRHIGDVLLTVPVFRALRETFTGAKITALINSGMEEVLTGNPSVDRIIVFDRAIKSLPLLRRYQKEILFIRRIREEGADLAVDLTGGDRSAILSYLSGARYRIALDPGRSGFFGKRRLYTHLTEFDASLHTVIQNLEVISRHGISTNNYRIEISIDHEEIKGIKDILTGHGVTENDTIVHIHPTSRWLFKCWTDEYMAEIINWLVRQGVRVVLTSSTSGTEMERIESILSSVPERDISNQGLINLCGRTSLKELAVISSLSDLFFGVDSAPMHIAAAVDTPVVALFGPSGAFNWGPWDNDQKSDDRNQMTEITPYPERNGVQSFGIHTVIQRDWDCIPCGMDGCNGTKKSRCLADITPDEVKSIISSQLERVVD